MLITNEFVMINFPKTGSTFARAAIKQMYNNRDSRLTYLARRIGLRRRLVTEMSSPNIHVKYVQTKPSQHGTFQQIPREHRKKVVVSITRNPFSRLVSTYRFGWWKDYPPAPLNEVRNAYPHFPDLSLQEYYEMMHTFGGRNRLGNIETKADVGVHTITFVQYYFRDPKAVLLQLDSNYVETKSYMRDMGSIVFLHQENLRTELKRFLLENGAAEAEVKFIDTMAAENESKSTLTKGSTNGIIPQELREQIIQREQLLFAIFPEYLS